MDYRIHFKMYLANAATKMMSGFFRFCKADTARVITYIAPALSARLANN